MGLHRSFTWTSRAAWDPIACHYVGALKVHSVRNYTSVRTTKKPLALPPFPALRISPLNTAGTRSDKFRKVHLYSREIGSIIPLLLEFSRKTSCINIGRVTESNSDEWLHFCRCNSCIFFMSISTVIWGGEVHIQYCNLEDLYKAKWSFIHLLERIIKVHFWYHQ